MIASNLYISSASGRLPWDGHCVFGRVSLANGVVALSETPASVCVIQGGAAVVLDIVVHSGVEGYIRILCRPRNKKRWAFKNVYTKRLYRIVFFFVKAE